MVRSERFDPDHFIAGLASRAFGIDLHWLPHAHGALRWLNGFVFTTPTPIILGGYSATYFWSSSGIPLWIMCCGAIRPRNRWVQLMRFRIVAGTEPLDVPNLTWKSSSGDDACQSSSLHPGEPGSSDARLSPDRQIGHSARRPCQ